MINLHLHGPAAALLKRAHPAADNPLRLHAASPADALRAVITQVPGVEQLLRAGAWRLTVDDVEVDADTITHPAPANADLHLHPVAAGAGGVFKAIGSLFGAILGIFGLDFSPDVDDYGQREDSATRQSYLFDGPVNTNAQGGPVPIVIGGPIRVGSVTLSAGIDSYKDASPYGDRAGAGAPADFILSARAIVVPAGSAPPADSLVSNATIRILDLVSEGRIDGLVAGDASVFLDGSPIFVEGARQHGVIKQAFHNFASDIFRGGIERERRVGADLLQDRPVTRVIESADVNAARVTIRFPALFRSNGGLKKARVDFRISTRSSDPAAPWRFQHLVTVNDKASSPAELSYYLRLPGSAPHTVRVERRSEDSTDDKLRNTIQWARLTEIRSVRIYSRHAYTVAIAAVAKNYNGQIRRREYEVRGLLVRVPTNYTPATRAYAGVWGGDFARAWTDNGAWIAYDLLSNKRYGLGRNILPAQLERAKWEFYAIAKFNDELVPDGAGGFEPRFRVAGVLQKQADATRVMAHLLGAFNAALYYGAGGVMPVQDRPADPSLIVTEANVIDGEFKVEELAHSQRYSAVAMSFNDPADGYKLGVELVVDDDLVRKYGYRQTDKVAMHCTSRSQAARMARYFLYAQERESDTMTYRAGLDHAALRPGAIIKQTDSRAAGKRYGFRIAERIDDPARPAARLVGGADEEVTATHWDDLDFYVHYGIFDNNTFEYYTPAGARAPTTIGSDLLLCARRAAPVGVIWSPVSNALGQAAVDAAAHAEAAGWFDAHALVFRTKRAAGGPLVNAAYLPLGDAVVGDTLGADGQPLVRVQYPAAFRVWTHTYLDTLDPPAAWLQDVCVPPAQQASHGATHIDTALLRIADIHPALLADGPGGGIVNALLAPGGAIYRADKLPADLGPGPWTLSVMLPTGAIATAPVQSIYANLLFLADPLPQAAAPGAMACIESAEAPARLWRVIKVAERDALEYDVTCKAHDPEKYRVVEQGLRMPPQAALPAPALLAPPALVTVRENLRLEVNKYLSDLEIGVTDPPDADARAVAAVEYQIREAVDNQPFTDLLTGGHAVVARDYPPEHEYIVRARYAGVVGAKSGWTESAPLLLAGKTTQPDFAAAGVNTQPVIVNDPVYSVAQILFYEPTPHRLLPEFSKYQVYAGTQDNHRLLLESSTGIGMTISRNDLGPIRSPIFVKILDTSAQNDGGEEKFFVRPDLGDGLPDFRDGVWRADVYTDIHNGRLRTRIRQRFSGSENGFRIKRWEIRRFRSTLTESPADIVFRLATDPAAAATVAEHQTVGTVIAAGEWDNQVSLADVDDRYQPTVWQEWDYQLPPAPPGAPYTSIDYLYTVVAYDSAGRLAFGGEAGQVVAGSIYGPRPPTVRYWVHANRVKFHVEQSPVVAGDGRDPDVDHYTVEWQGRVENLPGDSSYTLIETLTGGRIEFRWRAVSKFGLSSGARTLTIDVDEPTGYRVIASTGLQANDFPDADLPAAVVETIDGARAAVGPVDKGVTFQAAIARVLATPDTSTQGSTFSSLFGSNFSALHAARRRFANSHASAALTNSVEAPPAAWATVIRKASHDFGEVIPKAHLRLRVRSEVLEGYEPNYANRVRSQIRFSADGSAWTTVNADDTWAENFRYVGWQIDVRNMLIAFNDVEMLVDLREGSDSGKDRVRAADANGTRINFHRAFLFHYPPVVTPLGTTGLIANVRQAATDSDHFFVTLHTPAGTRADGEVAWEVLGYIP